MPKYEANGSIRHNGKRYKKGDFAELPADEKKSNLFVLVGAPKAEPKAEAPKPKAAAKKTDAPASVVSSAPNPVPFSGPKTE